MVASQVFSKMTGKLLLIIALISIKKFSAVQTFVRRVQGAHFGDFLPNKLYRNP